MGITASASAVPIKIYRNDDLDGWAKRVRICYENHECIVKIKRRQQTRVIHYKFSVRDLAETVTLCYGWLILANNASQYCFNIRICGDSEIVPTAADIFQYVCPSGRPMPKLYNGTATRMIYESGSS